MNALFLIDNTLAMEMFRPVIAALPREWEPVLVNYDGRTNRSRIAIEARAKELGVRCELLKRHNKKSVDDILRREEPNIVIFAREETTPVEPLFIVSCKRRHIPTLLIPHGALMKDAEDSCSAQHNTSKLKNIYLLAKQGYHRLRREDQTLSSVVRLIQTGIFRLRNDYNVKGVLSRYDNYSKVACYGDEMKEILLSYGVPEDNIVLTGNPRLDASGYTDNSNGANTILLITDYLVEAGMWTPRQRENYILSIYAAVIKLGSPTLEIKIHPVNEDIDDYQSIIEKHRLPVTVHQSEPTEELINRCSVAITLLSTAGIEVLLAKKPLVVFDPYDDIAVYKETDGVFVTHNTAELSTVLGRILKDGVSHERATLMDKFVSRHVYRPDKKASGRIVDLITEMVKGETVK